MLVVLFVVGLMALATGVWLSSRYHLFDRAGCTFSWHALVTTGQRVSLQTKLV
jgi:hypothetical protein